MTLGDLVLDVVVRPSLPPVAGSDVPGTLRFRPGGSAANAAREAVRLGAAASLIAAVGDDAWGRRLAAALRAEGVRPRLVTVAGTTARLAVLVGPDGERTFVTERGVADALAAAAIRPAWLAGAGALLVSAYACFAPGPAAAAARAALVARAAGAIVSVDAASAAPIRTLGAALVRERIAALAPDLLLANEAEAAALDDDRPADGRDERLLELAPLVVRKRGPAGCVVVRRDGHGRPAAVDVPTHPLDAADTTGAGDAFAAGFLVALLRADADRARDRRPAVTGSAAVLRRAALAGHAAATDLLVRPRTDLDLATGRRAPRLG